MYCFHLLLSLLPLLIVGLQGQRSVLTEPQTLNNLAALVVCMLPAWRQAGHWRGKESAEGSIFQITSFQGEPQDEL